MSQPVKGGVDFSVKPKTAFLALGSHTQQIMNSDFHVLTAERRPTHVSSSGGSNSISTYIELCTYSFSVLLFPFSNSRDARKGGHMCHKSCADNDHNAPGLGADPVTTNVQFLVRKKAGGKRLYIPTNKITSQRTRRQISSFQNLHSSLFLSFFDFFSFFSFLDFLDFLSFPSPPASPSASAAPSVNE